MFEITRVKSHEIGALFREKRHILRQEGILAFLRDIAIFTKKLFLSYYKGYLYEETLGDGVIVPRCSLDNLKIKPIFIPNMTLLEYEDFGEDSFDFPSHPDAQEHVPECEEAPETGMVILYATANGEFVHRNATTLSGKGTLYEKLQKRICPPLYSMDDKRTAYRALCVTNSKYRGKGVYRHLEFEMHNYMRKKGFSKLIYTVDPNMVFDVKLFDKLEGSEARFKFYWLRLLTMFSFIWVRPCAESPLVELGISS